MYKTIKISEGDRFNKLVVIKELPRKVLPCGQRIRQIECRCDCGNTTEVSLLHLVRDRIKSCGCLSSTRNGESKTKLYLSWKSMHDRCSKNHIDHRNYHDRGIIVENPFYDWDYYKRWALKNGFKVGLQIDRINNNGNYHPDNCRFVTNRINANNRRDTFYVTYKGEEIAFCLLIHDKGLYSHMAALRDRIKRGWSVDRAIDTPIRKGNYRTNTRN